MNDVKILDAGGHWVIAKNIDTIEPFHNGSRMRSVGRIRVVYDAWNGEGWTRSMSLAKRFATEDEAWDHLVGHWNQVHGLE